MTARALPWRPQRVGLEPCAQPEPPARRRATEHPTPQDRDERFQFREPDLKAPALRPIADEARPYGPVLSVQLRAGSCGSLGRLRPSPVPALYRWRAAF